MDHDGGLLFPGRTGMERFSKATPGYHFKEWGVSARNLIVAGREYLARSGVATLASIGAPNSPHKHDLAADIHVPGQSNLIVANEAANSALFGGVGWYEEGYNPGRSGEGPHVHVDLRQNDPADYGNLTPARWGFDKSGDKYHGSFPTAPVTLNSSSGCGCGNH